MSRTCSTESLRFWLGEPGSSEQQELFDLDPLDVADRLNVLESDNYTLTDAWRGTLAQLRLHLDQAFVSRIIDAQIPPDGEVGQRRLVRGLVAALKSASPNDFPYADQLRTAAERRFSTPDCGFVALAVAIKEAAKFGGTFEIHNGQVKRTGIADTFDDRMGVLGLS